MAFLRRKKKPVPRTGIVAGGEQATGRHREPPWLQLDTADPGSLIPAAWALLGRESGPLDRHFTYNLLEQALYRSRDDFDGALGEFDRACEAHDSEMVIIRAALLADFDGVLPGLPTDRQQAIRQSKARDYSRMLWWAERGMAVYRDDALDPKNVEDLAKRAQTARNKLNGA